MRNYDMHTVPHIEEPPSPRLDTESSAPGIPKSKLRALFYWRKPSNASLRPSTRSGAESVHHHSLPPEQKLRPRLSSRTRSDNTRPTFSHRPVSADNRASRIRDRLIADPPPLAQAYGQAILHAQLETPTSFTEKPSNHSESSHLREQLSTDFLEDKIEVKRSHKKTDSTESSCSTQMKIFFLLNGPYVLQYGSDGVGDALPEKILTLDRDSIAFASDAVPGQPWVLQISKPQMSANRFQPQTLRPSWSRLTLRQPEDRRSVNNLLLVFKDSEELYTWLFATRKEIENLGGLEFKSDAADDDQTWRENLKRTYATPSASNSDSRNSSTVRREAPRTSPQSSKKVGRQSVESRTRSHSDQSFASSKTTSTSLDGLRDSVASDSYTSTLATSCAGGSAPSTSPTCETFPSIKSVADHAKGDLSLRVYSRKKDQAFVQGKSILAPPSLLERRKVSMHSLHLSAADDSTESQPKPLPDLPSTISAPTLDTPPQLPSLGILETFSIYRTTEKSPDQSKIEGSYEVDKSKEQMAGTRIKHSSQKPSIAESSNVVPRAKYSLFPVCPPSGTKDVPLVSPPIIVRPPSSLKGSPPAPVRPSSQLKLRNHLGPTTRKTTIAENRHKKSRSRTVTLELRQHRVSALLGAGEFDQPQRSPAVTDEMIMMNFGVARDEPPPSPMPEIQVPGLSDLKFDMDFLKAPYRVPSKSHDSSPVQRRTLSTRSASSTQLESLAAHATAPAGPPPVGPLPAIPTHSRPSSRDCGSSQNSQQDQDRSFGDVEMPESQPKNSSQCPSSFPIYMSKDSQTDRSAQRDRPTWSNSVPTSQTPKDDVGHQPQSRSESRSQSNSRGPKMSVKQN